MCFLTISLTVHLLARTLSADFQSTKLGSLLAGKIKKKSDEESEWEWKGCTRTSGVLTQECHVSIVRPSIYHSVLYRRASPLADQEGRQRGFSFERDFFLLALLPLSLYHLSRVERAAAAENGFLDVTVVARTERKEMVFDMMPRPYKRRAGPSFLLYMTSGNDLSHLFKYRKEKSFEG